MNKCSDVYSPLVSILIAAYKADFFDECLSSALSQTYSNIEIVVSDDCPDDEISAITRSKDDKRIRYYRNEPANGPMFNYVESFNKAKGDLIKFLNDDDLLDPQCLEAMVALLAKESVSVVTTYRKEIDSDGKDLPDRLHNMPLFNSNVFIEGHSLAASMLMHRLNFVGEPSCFMFRKKDVESVIPHLMSFGGSGYERSGLGDVGLILNLLRQGECLYIGEQPLVQIRVFDGQWQQQSNARQWSVESWRVFRLHAVEFGMMSKLSLGWRLRYRSIGDAKSKGKTLVSFLLLKHQMGWLLRLCCKCGRKSC